MLQLPLLAPGSPPPGPHNYSFGSGMFGQWKQDRFGFPVYALDVTKDWPTLVGGGMLGNLHQVGNDRLIGMAQGDGSLSIRHDEGGPQWLQAIDPAVGQHGGALGYLLSTAAGGTGSRRDADANLSHGGPELLLHTLNTPESPLGAYELGIGYASKTKIGDAAGGAGVRVAHSVVAPFGDGTAMLVSVKVENLGPAARTLSWVEQWGRLGALVRSKGIDDTMRGYRHSIVRSASKDGGTILLDTVTSPTATGNTTAPAEHDPSPRPVFLASLGRPASRCGVDGTKLYPHGNSSTPDLANGLSATCGGAGAVEQSTITALEVPFTVGPHAETELFFAVGYLLPDGTVAEVLEALLGNAGDADNPNPDGSTRHSGAEPAAGVWNASSAAWAATGFVFDVPAEGVWPARETAWHSYLLRASLTFDSFFGAHVLNQNGNYQYQWGQNIATRDPLNHVMPLLYIEPKFVREQIVMAVATSSKDGQLPYGVGNFGQIIPNDSSDIGLYALNAAARYVMATGHVHFLNEVIRTPWGSIEVGDALWKLARWYMSSTTSRGCGIGPHGLIKMHGGDYNDGIRSGCKMGNGEADESVLNSMMAVGIFRSWADVLEAATMTDSKGVDGGSSQGQNSSGGLTTNISALRAFASQQERAVSATWDENEHGGWFARAWSSSTGWCGTVTNASIWWSNAYALLANIPPLNTSANSKSNTGGGGTSARDKLVKSLSEALYTDAGVVFTNNSVHSSYTDAWWAGAMYQYEALGLRGHQDLALATWQRHSLALHSEQYPADLSGIWSSSDLWSKHGTSGCGGWEGGYCLHNTWTHTASVWGIPTLAGAEFNQRGLIVRPQLDQPRYTIRSPLFGAVKASDNEFAGWWMPMNGSSAAAPNASRSGSNGGWQRSMTLIFAAQNRAAFASSGSTLTVNGRAVAGASWSEPQVVVPLPASGGLCWCVQPKPNDTWCDAVLPGFC